MQTICKFVVIYIVDIKECSIVSVTTTVAAGKVEIRYLSFS